MTKAEMIKALIDSAVTPFEQADARALEAFSEEKLKVLVEAAEEPDDEDKDEEEPEVKALRERAEKAEADLRALTDKGDDDDTPAKRRERLLAENADIARMLKEREDADKRRKEAAIKTLTAAKAPFTKEELEAKGPDELEKLVALAGRTVVDRSLNAPAGSGAVEPEDKVPAPRSLVEAFGTKKAS